MDRLAGFLWPGSFRHRLDRLCQVLLKGEAVNYYRYMEYRRKHKAAAASSGAQMRRRGIWFYGSLSAFSNRYLMKYLLAIGRLSLSLKPIASFR